MKTKENKNIFTTIGASNHSKEERQEHDYYATEPKAVELLLELEDIRPLVLEPFCGGGHISKVLLNNGHKVISSDLFDRGFGFKADIKDYKLKDNNLYCRDKLIMEQDFDIVTNPPYKNVNSFTEYTLNLLRSGCKLIQFLKLTFMETNGRRELFKNYPVKRVWVSSARLTAAKNGDFEKHGKRAVAYCWYVWEKGYSGETIVKWFN